MGDLNELAIRFGIGVLISLAIFGVIISALSYLGASEVVRQVHPAVYFMVFLFVLFIVELRVFA